MPGESGGKDGSPFGCLIAFLVLWGATAFFAWGYDANSEIGRIPLVLVPFKLLSLIPWPFWLFMAAGLAVMPLFARKEPAPRRRRPRRKRPPRDED